MLLASGRTLREEFEIRRQDKRREEERQLDAKDDRDKREKKAKLDEQRDEQEFFELAATAVLATETEIDAFRVDLDHYDEAAVKALMKNEQLREAVQRNIDRMYEEAFTAPDGKKVFKSRDGLRVYDEDENEIPREQIDPDEINDKLPRSEDFSEAKASMKRLDEQREKIIEFQQEADDVRAKLDKGDVTKEELADFQKRLADKMPSEVMMEMPDSYQPEAGNQRNAEKDAPVAPGAMNTATRLAGYSGPSSGP